MNKNDNIPIVKLETVNLSDNYYTDKDGYRYDTSTLIQWCKDNNYKEFDNSFVIGEPVINA